MEKIIEIPEGYEARIEGDKVVLEPKESEDEKIRKAIESIIRVYGKTQGEWIAGYDMDTLVVHLRDAFAYLEKQKEQKPVRWSEEDENAWEYLHELISFGFSEHFFDAQTAADMREWLNNRLKSLKDKVQSTLHWKPSEEQMEWLEQAVRLSADKPAIHGVILSLYNDLKKLL